MWFTEDPWPPILLLCVAAIVLVGIWSSRQRAIWLAGAGACLLAAVGVYFIERAVVTDRERVMEKIFQLADAFTKGNRQTTLSFFSRSQPDLRDLASRALELVVVDGEVSIKDVAITIYNENSQADAVFRANGKFSYQGGVAMPFPTRWRVRWVKELEDNDWKIAEVQRMSIVDDKELGPFETKQ